MISNNCHGVTCLHNLSFVYSSPYFKPNAQKTYNYVLFVSTTLTKLTNVYMRLLKPSLGRRAIGEKTGAKEARREPCFSFFKSIVSVNDLSCGIKSDKIGHNNPIDNRKQNSRNYRRYSGLTPQHRFARR